MKYFTILLTALFLTTALHSQPKEVVSGKAWTFTYLKSTDGQKQNLKKFIQRNWFIYDSIAVKQGLLQSYKILENPESKEWDYVVVVVYNSARGYEGIQEPFEKIRSSYKKVLIDGKDLSALGKIVKSETSIEEKESNPYTGVLTKRVAIVVNSFDQSLKLYRDVLGFQLNGISVD
ncbi:MAG: hypothetical protein ACKO96_15020, partial [Flammeovirgaceae bacterium]